MTGVADHQLAVSGEQHAVPRVSRRQNTIEEVIPHAHEAKQIRRGTRAHQIARAIARQQPDRERRDARRLVGRLADGQSARGVAVELERHELAGAHAALLGVERALDDAEERHVVPRPRGPAARRPCRRPSHRARDLHRGRAGGDALVERHRDVDAERLLRRDARLGVEPAGAGRRRASDSSMPSSSSFTRPARLITWKPPLSVRIGPGQPMSACSPPSSRTTSAPGRCARWYAFDSTIVAPSSCSCAGVTPFTLPCVATGMNAGVSTTPCAVTNRPSRAPAGSSRTTANDRTRDCSAGALTRSASHRRSCRSDSARARPSRRRRGSAPIRRARRPCARSGVRGRWKFVTRASTTRNAVARRDEQPGAALARRERRPPRRPIRACGRRVVPTATTRRRARARAAIALDGARRQHVALRRHAIAVEVVVPDRQERARARRAA